MSSFNCPQCNKPILDTLVTCKCCGSNRKTYITECEHYPLPDSKDGQTYSCTHNGDSPDLCSACLSVTLDGQTRFCAQCAGVPELKGMPHTCRIKVTPDWEPRLTQLLTRHARGKYDSESAFIEELKDFISDIREEGVKEGKAFLGDEKRKAYMRGHDEAIKMVMSLDSYELTNGEWAIKEKDIEEIKQ